VAYQHFCHTIFHRGIITSLGGVYIIALLSYFEPWYFFWGEAAGKKLMMHLLVAFLQYQTDINQKQPTKGCVNTNPRLDLAWKYLVSMFGI